MRESRRKYFLIWVVIILSLGIGANTHQSARASDRYGATKACKDHTLVIVNGLPACGKTQAGYTHIHICENNFSSTLYSFLQETLGSYGAWWGYIDIDKIEKAKSLSFSNVYNMYLLNPEENLGYQNMKGIEFFSALEELDCSNGFLTQINLGRNTNLKKLDCAGNRLTQLDLSENINLEELDCSYNRLSSLDISCNRELVSLNVSNNPISLLLFLESKVLKKLDISNTLLTEITLGQGTELTELIEGKYQWRLLKRDDYDEYASPLMWTYEYAEDGTLKKEVSSPGWGGYTEYEYENGRVGRVNYRGQDGYTVEYTYDSQERVLTTLSTYKYLSDIDNTYKEITEEKQYSYNRSGRVINIRFLHADSGNRTNDWEAELECVWNELDQGSSVEYQLKWIKNSYDWEGVFNPDPKFGNHTGYGRVLRDVFDASGHRIRRDWADGHYQVWEYDEEGQLNRETNGTNIEGGYPKTDADEPKNEVRYKIVGGKLREKTWWYLSEGDAYSSPGFRQRERITYEYDKHGNLSRILELDHFSSYGYGEVTWEYVPIPGSEQPVLSNNDEEEKKVDLDALMGTDPTVYNNELAIIAAKLSLKTYDNKSANDESVRGYLTYELGFDEAHHAKFFDNNYGGGSLAYTVATRDYDGSDADKLLVIVCQGSTNLYELVKDATAGTKSTYEGYKVYDIVHDFFADIVETGLPNVIESGKCYKVLLTGHSLGGAAANLTGAVMTDAGAIITDTGTIMPDVATNKNDIFCYTFGSVNCIRSDYRIETGYENIHNVYNWLDTFSPKQYGGWLVTGMGNGKGKFGRLEAFSREYRNALQVFPTVANGAMAQISSHVNHDMDKYLDAVENGYVSGPVTVDGETDLIDTYAIIACPVDIEIANNGQVIARVVNNDVERIVSNIDIWVQDDVKHIMFSSNEQIDIKFFSIGDGFMDYFVECFHDGQVTCSTFNAVQLVEGKTMTSTIGGDLGSENVKLYVVDDSNTPIAEVQTDGTENQIENTVTVTDSTSIPRQAKEEDVEERTKQNNTLVPLIVGIELILIGLVIFLHWRRQSHNAHRQ